MANYKPDMEAAQELVIMQGLPASGKTTEAKRMLDMAPMTFKRVSKDDLRAMMDFADYSSGKELLVRALRDVAIKFFLGNGWSVIVDDTNLNPEHVEHLRKLVEPVSVVIVDLTDVRVSDCIKRDILRPHPIGMTTIRKMADKYLLGD